MYEDRFADRLSQLRIEKGISARDMSLSIGQNAGYINSIETGRALPSMKGFFFICEYLDVTPMEFFDFDASHPSGTDELYQNLKKLTDSQFESILTIIRELVKGNS